MKTLGAWEALHHLATRWGTSSFVGQTVLIVGGSRGLGLDLGRELAAAGCKLAFCARDRQDVERARVELQASGAAVLARVCDASRPEQVEALVQATLQRFGSLDMLITCAATIQVGPLELMTESDVEEALSQIFWTAYHPTMAVLPHMRERRSGRIVHVSSFGGRLGLPHMMPYCTAKFALTGFSASLRSEVAQDNISVTTITPGLLRTGAYVNAPYKGHHEREFSWFTAGLTMPLVSLPSRVAAKRILEAARKRKPESTLTAGIRGLVIANAIAPRFVAGLMALQNKLLPEARGGSLVPLLGKDVVQRSSSWMVRALERLGRANATAHHAYPEASAVTLPSERSAPVEHIVGPSTLLRATSSASRY